MTPDEIRRTFHHNEVYGIVDEGRMMALQILAIGELAAQIAELKMTISVGNSLRGGGGFPDGW